MDDAVRISDDIAVARFEPGRELFARLAVAGYRSVVSFQTEQEGPALPPEEERRLAEEAGLAFSHHPMSGDSLSDETVDRFRTAIEGLPKPVLLHCTSGTRAGAMALMHAASSLRLSGEEAVERAEKLGIVANAPQLATFMRSYVDRHALD